MSKSQKILTLDEKMVKSTGYRCLRFGILHLLLTELSFDTPGVEIGAFLKKKILSPIYIEVVHTMTLVTKNMDFRNFGLWTLKMV